VRVNRSLKPIMTAAASLLLGIWSSQAETVLFEDNFDSDSSANWNVFNAADSATEDFTVDWAFDYANTTYTSNSVALKIPPAPSSSGTTKGVKVTVNKNDDVAERSVVNLYPKDKAFSGDYAVRFDMWINYGTDFTTEFAIFGINHLGTEPNYDSTGSPNPLLTSDGVWFAVTGEAGAARDYRNYEGDAAGSPLEFKGLDGGFLDRDNNGTPEQEVIDLETDGPDFPLNLLFPSPPYETLGAPGKRWVQVEVRQSAGVITWLMNGYVIAEKVNASPWTEGDIMLGTMDIFTSVANPKADNFVIFDNLRVVDLGTDPAPPRLAIDPTTIPGAEPATAGSFTITRTGDETKALVINLNVRGTATSGQDYTAIPLTTNMAAGVTSLVIPVSVINDVKGEPVETVLLDLVGNPGQYEVFAPMTAKVEITDDNDITAVNVTASDPHSYEKIPTDTGKFKITRVGDTSSDLTVNFTVAGTAQTGVDYQSIGSSVVIPAGSDSALVTVIPIDNSIVEDNRTVVLTLATGTGYAIGSAAEGTVTIRNDDLTPGTLVFSDNFETDTTPDWNINEETAGSNLATFNFDYSQVGIPPAPNSTNGTTHGLKLQANVGAAGVFTGLSVSPKDKGFTGDYRLTFDMWVNYNGPLEVGGFGSTLSFSAGVGTSGDAAQFPGSSVQGVLFSVTGDGGSSIDYRAYVAIGAPLTPDTGAYAAGTQSNARNNNDPYYTPFGGVTAPDAQVASYPTQTGTSSVGAPGEAWHEVNIVKQATNVTWTIDGIRIATVTLTNKEISTNIFVGFFDINAGQTDNPDMSFGLVDNLKVEQLQSAQPLEIHITSVSKVGTDLQLDFTASGDATFVVQGSETVDGTYTDEAGAQITTVNSTTKRAVIPMTTPNRFFQIKGE
jgi:hypothetical protein